MKLRNTLPLLTAALLITTISSHASAPGDPTANAGQDTTVSLNSAGTATVTLDGSGTLDPFGQPVTYSWNALPSAVVNPVTGPVTTMTFNAAGTYTVTLTATNHPTNGSASASSTDTVVITVSPFSAGPVVLTPATNKVVECDGSGNISQLTSWLASHGGAVAPASAGTVTWTHNYTAATLWQDGVSPICDQVPVTFTATFANGNAATTTALFQIKDTVAPPLNWSVNGNPIADFTILTVPTGVTTTVKVIPNDLCGASVLQKSYSFLSGSGTVVYSSSVGGTVNDTISITSCNAAKVRFYFKATDECGNSSATEWVEVDVTKQQLSLKGNEGVGNGIDPNTPGALHNGNNDAPGTFPGSPGARYKRN
jgi:hypothetical protein